MKNLLYSVLLLCWLTNCQQPATQKTILLVVAHPDDETAISEALIKYAAAGHKVKVIIATNGKNGTRVTKIPAGDSLGLLRMDESRCGCAKLGIEPPVFLSIERLDTKIGVGAYFDCHRQLMDSLKAKIPAINPDVIITFGPDGDTHHSEHIVVGGAVTELLLREGWVEQYPLYYFTWPKEQTGIDELGYTDDRYFNVKVDYDPEYKTKAIEALKCYVTQYTPEELKAMEEEKLNDSSHVQYFRRFAVTKGLKEDFDFRTN